MGTKTRAHVALRRWISEDPKRTREFVGTMLGVTGAAVSQWLTIYSVPDLVTVLALQVVAGIDVSEWLTAAQRTHLDGVLADFRKQAA